MEKTANGFSQLVFGSLLCITLFLAATFSVHAADQAFACPDNILVMNVFSGQAPEGWAGAGEAGPYMFKAARITNQNQLMCNYSQKYVMSALYRPWEAGTTCTFEADKKTWMCKNAVGASKSYPCLDSMLISATAQGKPPDGWQGSGEAGPFPFLNALAPNKDNKFLRCNYRAFEFNYFLTRSKPVGLCSFDAAKMSWVCRAAAPARDIPVKPEIRNKQVLVP